VLNQAGGFAKLATGSTSQSQNPESSHAEGCPQSEPLESTNQNSQNMCKTRQKWSRDEYKAVMAAYSTATLYPKESSSTQETYNNWRNQHPDSRSYIDMNKLANTRRDIVKNKRLTEAELHDIRQQVVRDHEIMSPINNHSNNNQDELHQQGEGIAKEGIKTEPIINSVPAMPSDGQSSMTESIIYEWEILKCQPIEMRPKINRVQVDKKLKLNIKLANESLNTIKADIGRPLTITEINQLMYATALATAGKVKPRPTNKQQARRPPKWQRQLEKKIAVLRGDLSLVFEIQKGRVKLSKRTKFLRKYKVNSNAQLSEVREKIKQELQAKSQRLRRCKKRINFFQHNKLFAQDARKFYRSLGKKVIDVKQPPPVAEVEDFWAGIWENQKDHNNNASWLDDIETTSRQQEWCEITTKEVTDAVRNMANWKSPGPDGLQNFWLKKLESLHRDLASEFTRMLDTPTSLPDWFTAGVTILLPKNEQTQNPKNYRPITCLPTMYKALTSVLTNRLYVYMSSSDLLPPEQKGCVRGSYGCKEQLLVNRMILESCHDKKRNLSTAWIDYRKAFDSVPHSWILKTMRLYNISPTIIEFVQHAMTKWKTELVLHHSNGVSKSRKINIRRGIFQGDSLSPLLFCMALAPLSELLRNTSYGYKVNNMTYTHLLYMDDIKLFASNDGQLEGMLHTVKQFSKDIQMEFGLDKCAKATFIHGKLKNTKNITLDPDITIQELETDAAYKYLGVNEGAGIHHASMKDKIKKEYIKRIRLVLKSELNATNKSQAINALAVPVVTYSYNVINWTLKEIKRLDTKTRKLLTTAKMHHCKADIHRIYMPRTNGGRGLLQLEAQYKISTIGLDTYLRNSSDPMLQPVVVHEKKKKAYSVIKEAAKFRSECDLPDQPTEPPDNSLSAATQLAAADKVTAKLKLQSNTYNTWKDKPLHGRFPQRLSDPDINSPASLAWLRSAGLKPETEGLLIAAQDQALTTNAYRHHIIKDGTNPSCRVCQKYEETIDHIVSGCPELAKTEYTERHNRIARYVHWSLCRHYNIDTPDKYYQHEPKTVCENDHVTILWDMPITTDREIKANRPDIIVRDRNNKQCLLIDIAVPSDKNTSVKTVEKQSKYKDLEIEINRMWKINTCTIPVVVGALGLLPVTSNFHLDKLPMHTSQQEVQKIALLGSAHILRRVLSFQ
jgi:hypothetical protein